MESGWQGERFDTDGFEGMILVYYIASEVSSGSALAMDILLVNRIVDSLTRKSAINALVCCVAGLLIVPSLFRFSKFSSEGRTTWAFLA